MNNHSILESAAAFNATHDYNLEAVLKFTAVAARHAHLVQLARIEAADPQLNLPLEVGEEVLP